MSLSTSLISTAGRVLPGTRGGRLLTLIYHRVHPRPDAMYPGEVDAARFDWQMDLLRLHCLPISLRDGVAKLKSGTLPPRAVAVTFDDGYADNAAVALPILKKHGVHATFFIAAGFLDGGRMWNDSIIEAVRRADAGSIDLTDFQLGVVSLGSEGSRGPVAESIIRSVKHLPPAERASRVAAFCDRVAARLPDDLMMTSEQVRQLHDAGMEIGAHTMTHPILRTLTGEQARSEIVRSRDVLQAVTGAPVRAFAYPNGRPGDDYTSRDRDLVASLGFDFAPSTTWGVAGRDSDVFQLPRFTPWDRTPGRWLVRLLLAFRTIG